VGVLANGDLAQGYYLSPPLSEKELLLWLSHWSELTGVISDGAGRKRLSLVG
jgi:hypothetical protein